MAYSITQDELNDLALLDIYPNPDYEDTGYVTCRRCLTPLHYGKLHKMGNMHKHGNTPRQQKRLQQQQNLVKPDYLNLNLNEVKRWIQNNSSASSPFN